MSAAHPFAPVPVRARRDGWTPAAQVALARTRNVAAACRAVGRSWQTAYRLRARPDAADFAAAWDAALAQSALPTNFTGRAMDGMASPIFYRSRQVGERRRYDNRLAMYLLRIRLPERFGEAHGERPARYPDPADISGQPAKYLAASIGICQEGHFSADVASMSSPSAPPTGPGTDAVLPPPDLLDDPREA